MSVRRRALLLLLPLLLRPAPAVGGTPPPAAEPAFCAPDTFLAHEIAPAGTEEIERLRVFRLGAVVLAGMAIGHSDADAVARLAAGSGATAAERYCTWYVNQGNRQAGRLFRQAYVPNPRYLTPDEAAEIYGDLFGPALAEGPGRLWWCLEEKGYFAVGCNGQKHRGPTAFGMVLAALGCSPEHAAEIVNRIWGLNDIPEESRLAAIRRAHEIGARRAELRARLQRLLSEPETPKPERP